MIFLHALPCRESRIAQFVQGNQHGADDRTEIFLAGPRFSNISSICRCVRSCRSWSLNPPMWVSASEARIFLPGRQMTMAASSSKIQLLKWSGIQTISPGPLYAVGDWWNRRSGTGQTRESCLLSGCGHGGYMLPGRHIHRGSWWGAERGNDFGTVIRVGKCIPGKAIFIFALPPRPGHSSSQKFRNIAMVLGRSLCRASMG